MMKSQDADDAPLSIALVGTRGVPARYGGFETAVEEIGKRLVERGHSVRVYCRKGNSPKQFETYLGMELVTLPALKKHAFETPSHTGLSTAHLVTHRTDVAFVFNAWNAVFLPALRLARIPVATHVDGLEWMRAKGGSVAQRLYRFSESAAVRWSDALIADARGIQEYYRDEFDVDSRLITYGSPILHEVGSDRLARWDLQPQGYHLVVARFVPENHVDMIVKGYVRSRAEKPLVVVGGGEYEGAYTKLVEKAANYDPRVRLVGGVWDQDELNQLYAHGASYVHGHSVGGTNPSLLRAIGAGTATLAFDVNFNREVLEEDGRFFADPAELAELFHEVEDHEEDTRARGDRLREHATTYSWDDVATGYEDLARGMVLRRTPGPQKVRRRETGSWTTSERFDRVGRV